MLPGAEHTHLRGLCSLSRKMKLYCDKGLGLVNHHRLTASAHHTLTLS